MGEIVNGVNLDTLEDEMSLYKLLDATEDFDERKVIRARLRNLQAKLREQRDEMMKKREEEREDMIRQRQKDAEEQKKRMLAMYDQMAKSAPAGATKVMDINIYKNAQASTEPVVAAQSRDLVEEAIQQRHREAEERKRKILAAYDAAARSGQPGSKTVEYNGVNDSVSAPATPTKPPINCTFGGISPPSSNQQINNNNQKMSAKAKFQQMDSVQNKQPGGPAVRANFRAGGAGGVMRSASDIKDMLLQWCKSKTREYQNIEITNFSTSWNDGMAFCALIHHFYPESFDFNSLNPKNRRKNFELAFRVADEKADIAPLLDVEDMVIMKKPDWKCVFTYVQSFYRKLHNVD